MTLFQQQVEALKSVLIEDYQDVSLKFQNEEPDDNVMEIYIEELK